MLSRNRSVVFLLVAVLIILDIRAAQARDVSVAIGFSLAPYVIQEEKRGMEYDIVKEALALEGHTMVPQYVPLGRVAKLVEAGRADAAMTQRMELGIAAHYSDVYITYRNFAITRASRKIKIDRVEDLSGKSILAFQNATVNLGPAFKNAVDGNPTYREEPKQITQPVLLFLGRVDVVIADRNIFNWFAHDPEVTAKVDTSQPVRYHAIFPPTDYRMAFSDSELRDSFNRGLAKLRQSGEYARIEKRYSPLMIEEPKQ